MRGSLKRRLRVAVPLAAVVAVVGLAAWLGPKLRDRKPAVPPEGDASLLVLVHLTDPDGRVARHQLLRVGFVGSEPQPPEAVWEGSSGFFSFVGTHRVLDGRYVVAASGGVIDVWANEELNEPASGVVEATAERVVFRRDDSRRETGLFALDLRTRKVEPVGRMVGSPDGDPNKRSPDGTKALTVLGATIRLYHTGGPQRVLGQDFHVQQGPNSSDSGTPQVLWLDNDRFLTQVGNGRLVSVALDGSRAPVIEVPAKTEVVGSPRLSRDPDGRVVYECGGDGFHIDVGARTGERCEWAALGRGFDAGWLPAADGRHAIRHRGTEIGRVRAWPRHPNRAAATEGRVALVDERDGGTGVQVWSAATGTWTALDVRAAALVGWLK